MNINPKFDAGPRRHLARITLNLLNELLAAPLAHADATVSRALQVLGDAAGFVGIHVFVRRDVSHFDRAYGWIAGGSAPQLDRPESIPISVLGPWLDDLRRDRCVEVQSLEALSADLPAWEQLLEQESASLLLVPMLQNGDLIGFLSYTGLPSAGRLNHDEVFLLRCVSNGISALLARRHTAEQGERAIADSQLTTANPTREWLGRIRETGMGMMDHALENSRLDARELRLTDDHLDLAELLDRLEPRACQEKVHPLVSELRRAERHETEEPGKSWVELSALIVDGDTTSRMTLKTMLEAAGIRVDLASDGREGLGLWKIRRHDLILVEVAMQVMDGVATLTAITGAAEQGRHPPPVAIAVAEHAFHPQLADCRAAGFDRCLAKPVQRGDLHSAIAAFWPQPR